MTARLSDSTNGMADPTTEASARAGGSLASMEDPFVSNTEQSAAARESHRFSSFDTQLFSLNASSPAQAKRALEAHLAETERRLEEASKLGTALVEQQRGLAEQLKEVERQQDEGEMGLELRQRLADLEREYNDIGRETARAFLAPKRLAGGAEDAPFATPSFDGKSPLHQALFAGQATNSPSKVSVPSRKQRNQPSSRVHDIEFATEISTSLLAQVRQLQALLAEREDTLKSVNLEKSRLEIEAEGYAQRIRALDDNEQRYKDENWALETQTHELIAAAKEASDRENRLNSSLSTATSEKSAVVRELEELRQTNAKQVEEQTTAQKANDAELHVLRRNLNASDAEKLALQKKLEEMTSQNQELAKAVAVRLRQHDYQGAGDLPQDGGGDDPEQTTPDNSPPPSPNKFTPRHNHLESETLKSSLGHAHRMIQNLKSTIHREKTEKIELKRMLQEARDEVEQRRREVAGFNSASNKRQKAKQDSFRKPPRPDLLGSGRKEQSFVELHDTDWEDNAGQGSPTRRSAAARSVSGRSGALSPDEPSDIYQTATEAEAGFETANERGTATESEAFQTGVESMADDSSDSADLTETEDRVQTTPRTRVASSLVMAKARDRTSFHSTASTSADEDEETGGGHPSPGQAYPPRSRARSKRNVQRRLRPSGEAPMASNSRPSSARNSPAPSFEQAPMTQDGQSLFAELADLEGPEEEDEGYGAASQASTPRIGSRRSSEAMLDPPHEPVMVDSGMMTDPWEPMTPVSAHTVSGAVAPSTPTLSQGEAVAETKETPKLVSSGTQWTPLKSPADHLTDVPTPPKMVWDENSEEQRGEADTRSEPTEIGIAPPVFQETLPEAPRRPALEVSYMTGCITSPVKHEIPAPELPDMTFSSIASESTEPVVAAIVEPVRDLPELSLSSLSTQFTTPIQAKLAEPVREPVAVPAAPSLELAISSISSEQTEPVLALPQPAPQPEPIVVPEPTRDLPELSISRVDIAHTEPVAPHPQEAPVPPAPPLSVSSLSSVETRPITALPRAPVVADLSTQTEPEHPKAAAVSQAGAGLALSDISGNALPHSSRQQSVSVSIDHGAQTILSSKQIDQILMDRESTRPLSSRDSNQTGDVVVVGATTSSPSATLKARSRQPQSSTPSSKRPGSATSHASGVSAHPPLPIDHREAILAAERKSIDMAPPSPTVMGPPLAPASAYRMNAQGRPGTPNEATPQAVSARTASSRAKARRSSLSQVSRRSSVSSFASELEERFNMQTTPSSVPQEFGTNGSNTEPRMIQAVTQTMIGEFLWKYTRKPVSGDFSSSRHRRYFWVHPYTRTLYWSDQDPQTAGKNALKTKSVPIEAVRVVKDDNPYPPGLHRRSLEVVSPGRRVRFTATTSQRHETWLNALSYLLLRETTDDGEENENGVTLDEINEFNPGFRAASRKTARMSFSSQNSRVVRQAPKQHRAASAMSMRSAGTPGRASPALSSPNPNSGLHIPEDPPQRSSSRLSSIFNNSIRGSIVSLKGRHGQASSAHEESLRGQTSSEDMKQAIEAEEQDRLENVRACCDGKHDVSSLSRTSRYSPKVNRIHSHN